MSWNYRILAHKSNNDDMYLQIHEVYYNENNIPIAYTKNPISIGGTDIDEILWVIDKIRDAVNKPILLAGEKFPNEYRNEDLNKSDEYQ